MKKSIVLLLATPLLFLSSCYKDDIAALKNDVQTLQAKVDLLSSVLNNNTNALQRRADSLSAALSVTNNNLNQTNTIVTNTNKTIDSIKTQLLLINNNIKDINTKILSNTANVTDLNNQIAALNKQYADLATILNTLVQSSFIYALRLEWNSGNLSNARVYAIDSTKWHYVAVTIDNSREVKFYIDGVLGSDYYRPVAEYIYSNLYIGSSFYTSFTHYYKGAIDELRVSNRVRTQSEIQDYYNLACVGILIYPNPIVPLPKQTLDNATLGLWHFDETAGTTFANSVSNKQAGQLFGGSSFIKGISGNAISFNGTTGRGDCNMSLQSAPLTIEFWFKTNTVSSSSSIVQPYGMYNSDILLELK
jgi:hypothetical protein